MLTPQDLQQIERRGSFLATIEGQLKHFREGFPHLKITQPATTGDGIVRLSEEGIEHYVATYESTITGSIPLKFVPASGAASRMFKQLFSFLHEFTGTEEEIKSLEDDHSSKSMNTFFKRLKDFAFYQDLKAAMAGEVLLEEAVEQKNYGKIIAYLLTDQGLNYGDLPKGLLKFHKYPFSTRTPVEEHMVEGAHYAQDSENIVRIHFTVSPEHRTLFESLIATMAPEYEEAYSVKFEISFSEQKSSTDTIAVDLENHPFREEDGSVLFRPGGHGALIENLNDMEADIIFIKNIDNVVPDTLKTETFRFKKALGGVLFYYQEKIFSYLKQIDELNQPDLALLESIRQFLKKELCLIAPEEYDTWTRAEKIAFLRKKLNRPIRVCGMVKNEGEPGGGPFWTKNDDGTISLQIVEMAQIDTNNESQQAIVQRASHFNPVDLVCATKNYLGQSFNLLEYRDPQTGFISKKSKNGKDLKAQELPGLWNGAMANWNTIFVEVPIITFNPVKTVFDLLRDEHQA